MAKHKNSNNAIKSHHGKEKNKIHIYKTGQEEQNKTKINQNMSFISIMPTIFNASIKNNNETKSLGSH